MNNNISKDFRDDLYKEYFSSFRAHILDEKIFYDKGAYSGYRKVYIPLIKNYSKDARIIDLGCGTGILLDFLRSEGYNNLSGIDLSEQQIELAKKNGFNVEIKGIFDFFRDNTEKYDVIFAIDLIEHFYKNELIDLFKGFFSTLNEGGSLIIHTPNGDGVFHQHIIYGDLTHLTIFNSNSLNQILRIVGFKDIACLETGPTTKNLLGLIRFTLWKIIRIFIKAIRIIETGGSEKILTQDFICIAKK